MKLIFLGAPGAGKGTQASLLSKHLDIPHISTGEIFRENIKNKTELGKKVQEYADKGLFVPDDVTNSMVKERLARDDCEKGYILDGFPRTIPQAEFLSSIQEINHALYFKLSDEEAVKRMMHRAKDSNRADDTPEVMKKRIEVYKEQTHPLIHFYENHGSLITVDASHSIKQIQDDVKLLLSV